jgi:hypothetical protein
MKGRLKALGFLVLVALASCDDSTDSNSANSQRLPAPQHLWVFIANSGAVYSYDFNFNAVEFADGYLVYYSATNDTATAKSLSAGQFPPIRWSYPHSQSYGGQTYYFWVRAFDGEHYGEWSDTVTSVLN